MPNYIPPLIYPQPVHISKVQESWHFLECPSSHAAYNPFPGDKPRRMWVKLAPATLATMLKNGWKEVTP